MLDFLLSNAVRKLIGFRISFTLRSDNYQSNPFTIICMESWNIVITLGNYEKYSTLSEVLTHIPSESSRILIEVSSDLVQDVDVDIPTNKGIDLIKISSSGKTNRTIEFLGGNFFTNGIPLEIDSTITLKNCFLFGGSKADFGKSIARDSSHISIKGIADYVFGGGYAIGKGSISKVQNVSLEVSDGMIGHLYGGGYAVQGGSVHSDRIRIQTDKKSSVTTILSGGSCLPGPASQSFIREINLNLSGDILGKVFLAGHAAYGSSIRISEIIRFTAADAKFEDKIYSGNTIGRMSAIGIGKISGSISEEYGNLLQIKNTDIKLVKSSHESDSAASNQEPSKKTETEKDSAAESQKVPVQPQITKEKTNVQGPAKAPSEYPVDTVIQHQEPYKPARGAVDPLPAWDASEDFSPKAYPQKPKRMMIGITISIICIIFLCLCCLLSRCSKSTTSPTSTPSPTIRTTATKILPTKTAVKTSTATPRIIVPSNTPESASTIDVPEAEVEAITDGEQLLIYPSVITVTIVPSLTLSMSTVKTKASKTPLPTQTSTVKPSDTSVPTHTSTIKPSDTPFPTETSIISRNGIIRAEDYIGGTYLLATTDINGDIVRWLKNNTEIRILDGPVNRNGYTWYWINCPAYNQNGWVLANFIDLNAK